MKIGRAFIKNVPMTNKASSMANDFYGRMVKKGFDAVLDTNDGYTRWGATQDPLIIFNMEKLGKVNSVKLTKEDLDSASSYVGNKKFNKKKKDTSHFAHCQIGGNDMDKYDLAAYESELYHYGVPGMKWGHRKARPVTTGSIGAARMKMQQAKANKKAASKSFDKAYRHDRSLMRRSQFDKADNKRSAQELAKAAEKSNQADKDYKKAKKAYKAVKKMEQQKVEKIKAKYAKEYQNGKTIGQQIGDKILGREKYYSEIMYNLNEGAKKKKRR